MTIFVRPRSHFDAIGIDQEGTAKTRRDDSRIAGFG